LIKTPAGVSRSGSISLPAWKKAMQVHRAHHTESGSGSRHSVRRSLILPAAQ
jgi:hypothetical protein